MGSAANRQADAFLKDWLWSRELARSVNLQVMREAGLSATLLTILNLLDANQPMSAVALAARMNVHPSTIVRSLDELEEHRFIARRRNPADRRELQVTLATGGERLKQRLYGALAEHIRMVFARMPAESRTALLAGFRAFVEVSSAMLTEEQEREGNYAER